MAKMPLGPVLSITSSHCTLPHFVLEMPPAILLPVSLFDSNTFPPSLPHFRLKRLFLLQREPQPTSGPAPQSHVCGVGSSV